MKPLQSVKVQSLDILRCLVLVLLAIDHVKDYFLIDTFEERLLSDNFAFFLTQFCIPAISFLLLTSPLLYDDFIEKSNITKQVFLRGYVLIFAEIIIYYIFSAFNISHEIINLDLLRLFGFCMLILSGLFYLPKKIILFFGILFIFGQNLLESIIIKNQTLIYSINNNVLGFDNVQVNKSEIFWFSYPIIPWIGVFLLAYYFISLERKSYNIIVKNKIIFYLGLVSVLLFFIIKGSEMYVLSNKQGQLFSLISFLKLTKYSFSVKLLLITLGPLLMVFSYFQNRKFNFSKNSFLFGKAPFFIFVIHVLVIHLTAFLGLLITGNSLNKNLNLLNIKNHPNSLIMVYLVWVCIALLLYPFLLKYSKSRLNRDQKNWLVKYY